MSDCHVCRNCDACVHHPWAVLCADCVRMVALTLAVELGTAVGAWLTGWWR